MEIEKIKLELKKQKITYDKLAEMTGLSKSAISKIFSGIATNPRADTMDRIITALEVSSKNELVREYLSEQEENLLRRFRKLSKKNRSTLIGILQVLEKYES